MRFVALSFAGGNRYSLGFIRDILPDSVEFTPLEWSGRGMRMYEPLQSDIYELSNDLFHQLQQLDDDRYVLFGDCVGALLAFLISRKLVKENKPLPVRLMISGCPAPALFKEKKETMMEENDIKERLVRFGTDPALLAHKGFYDMIEPIMRADFQAFNNYVYTNETPLPVPITVFTDEQATIVDETRLWQQETSSPITIVKLPGTLKNSMSGLAKVFREVFASTFAD